MKRIVLKLISICLVASTIVSCKKEVKTVNYAGAVMLYSSMESNELQLIKTAFENKYPGITLDYYYSTPENVIEKINIEKKSGFINADLVWFDSMLGFEIMDKELLENYKSKEAKKIPSKFKDKNGIFTGVSAFGVGFLKKNDNTNKIKNWNDFASYDGNLCMVKPEHSFAAKYMAGALLQNKKYGETFLLSIKDKISLENRESTIYRNVNDGIYDVATVFDSSAYGYIDAGYDCTFNYLDKDNIFMISNVSLLNDAPNKDNAKLLIDFMISPEGQKALMEADLIPLRTDIKNPVDSSYKFKGIMDIDYADLAKNLDNYSSRFIEILTK